MSREDLIDAYVSGEISRRTFIRRLAAAGVSLAAAGAYAQLLGTDDAQAARAPRDGFYEPVHGGFYDSANPAAKSDPPQGRPADGLKPAAGNPAGTLSVEDFTLADAFRARRLYVDVTGDRPVAITLSAATSAKGRRRGARLASTRASLPAAGGKNIALRLSRTAALRLRAARGRSIVFTAVLKSPDGPSTTLSVRTSAIP